MSTPTDTGPDTDPYAAPTTPDDVALRVAETDPSGGEGLPAYADRKAIVVR